MAGSGLFCGGDGLGNAVGSVGFGLTAGAMALDQDGKGERLVAGRSQIRHLKSIKFRHAGSLAWNMWLPSHSRVYHSPRMADPIYMRVGEGQAVDLPEFVGAMGNFLGLLREVDSTVAEKKGGHLRWRVTTLNNAPSPLVGVTPLLLRNAGNDTSTRVEREIINNVVSLTEKGERNKFLSDAALSRVERIAKSAPKIGESVIYTDKRGDVSLSTKVTIKTLTQVQDLTSIKSISFGTVVGSLDSISVHHGKEFRVWDENFKRPVRCRFHAKQESQAKDLLGLRVIVTGMVSADRYGQPLSMNVENLEGAALGMLPSIEEMVGLVPNFTGGLSLREFFEDME